MWVEQGSVDTDHTRNVNFQQSMAWKQQRRRRHLCGTLLAFRLSLGTDTVEHQVVELLGDCHIGQCGGLEFSRR